MAIFKTYRTYSFVDKDPVIDEIRTIVQEEGLIKKLGIVHELSGVSVSTLDNWFNGQTISPQNRTVSAVITSLGYKRAFTKAKDIDIEKELKIAKRWADEQQKLQEKAERVEATRKKRKRARQQQGKQSGLNP